MDLKQLIDIDRLPQHVAIIMDGNGRWAKNKGKFRIFGHQNGVKAVRDVVEAAAEIGVHLGRLPRPVNQTHTWADQVIVSLARIGRKVTLHIKAIAIQARPNHGAERRIPARIVFDIQTNARFYDVVLPRYRQRLTRLRVVQAIKDIVVLKLHAEGGLAVAGLGVMMPAMRRIQAAGDTFVRLRKLIAMQRIVHEVGEVGPQV